MLELTEELESLEKEVAGVHSKTVKRGSKRLHKGQILWEFHRDTRSIEKVKYEETQVDMNINTDQLKVKRHKLIIDDNCVYVIAINKKNATRKLKKLGYLKVRQ